VALFKDALGIPISIVRHHQSHSLLFALRARHHFERTLESCAPSEQEEFASVSLHLSNSTAKWKRLSLLHSWKIDGDTCTCTEQVGFAAASRELCWECSTKLLSCAHTGALGQHGIYKMWWRRELGSCPSAPVIMCVRAFISRTPRAKMCRVGKDCNAKAAWNVHSFVTCRMFRVVCEYFHGAFDGDKEIFDGTRAVEMKERVCVCVCVSKSSFACGMISAGSSCVRQWQAERVREVCNSVNTSALRCSICPVHSTVMCEWTFLICRQEFYWSYWHKIFKSVWNIFFRLWNSHRYIDLNKEIGWCFLLSHQNQRATSQLKSKKKFPAFFNYRTNF